jgi:plastocyanin domain-containing protein
MGRITSGARLATGAVAAAAALVLSMAVGTGCSRKSDAPPESTVSMLASATGEARVVADEHGFTPDSLAVPKGPPGSKVTLTFLRTTDKTCATEVVFPEAKIDRPLPLNVPVSVEVASDTARTLSFQCGMGMFKGALVVK